MGNLLGGKRMKIKQANGFLLCSNSPFLSSPVQQLWAYLLKVVHPPSDHSFLVFSFFDRIVIILSMKRIDRARIPLYNNL